MGISCVYSRTIPHNVVKISHDSLPALMLQMLLLNQYRALAIEFFGEIIVLLHNDTAKLRTAGITEGKVQRTNLGELSSSNYRVEADRQTQHSFHSHFGFFFIRNGLKTVRGEIRLPFRLDCIAVEQEDRICVL